MRGWETVPLGRVARLERAVINPAEVQPGMTYVGLEHIDGNGAFVGASSLSGRVIESSKFRFSERHLLYGKLRPYLAKIACPDFEGLCSTDILPLLAGPKLERRFLFHFLRQPSMVAHATARSVGANLPRLSPSVLETFELPLPPLPEQRRIAEVLDRAEALRAKRRAALAQLDGLTRAVFLDMFGDPLENPRGWPLVSLESLLTLPLRNGLSPSKAGRVPARVLTLSAITGDEFDSSAWKTSTFGSSPPADQSVDEADFLICRGNGNVALVGKGRFPRLRMPDVTFPDTMIAARVAPERMEGQYLEHVWNSRAVRRQVEAAARTTNGTFKVNQTMLENMRFIDPPLALQHEFARRAAAVDKIKAFHRASLTQLDALFASLQHRAFRGEL